MLSRENIYTLKLARRDHTIPKALQANMFLVRKAKVVMERNVIVVPADLGSQRVSAAARPRYRHAAHRGRQW